MAANDVELLRHLFDAAIAASDPAVCLPPALPEPPAGRTVVVGAGKAAAAMARALENAWMGPAEKLSGLVVTRYGFARPTAQIEVVEAAHPVPDAAGVRAAARILDAVSGLGEDDLVIALMSGGGSALLTLPAPGITLADKAAVTDALLRSGAAIDEINTVRKHLSAIKAGRLAEAAYPAQLVTLAVSDVVGDDPATIASGPTVADPTTRADAAAVLDRYGIAPPRAVREHLASPESESPKPGDPRLAAADYRIVARGPAAIAAAAEAARNLAIEPVILDDAATGEARDVAREHATIATSAATENPGWPLVFLSGGELTVTLTGSGRGGPNTEYLLALALAFQGTPGGPWAIHALACDTDGIDGSEDNAGAVVTPDTLERAAAAGLDPRAFLDNNDAYGFFEALGDLVVTGPTGTNVNDFRALLVRAPPRR
ncbi:MAG TPA: glycerate kinase [Alphaproteobacteria bacterium]|nr:glycerate kinase [Alphaproteobacteria bacterium]